ncbi:hypothetical protein [Roseovarius salis]|uniref:hypothetical protein n=1 Tax=Roseovarius salis TaxID=3376063 RepID=UPI0037C551F1
MQRRQAYSATGVFAMAMVLMSCEPAGTLLGGGRADDYRVARQALETGDYSLAITRYERLLQQAGPSAGRLQLEYAHSLLRAGEYGEAISVSSELAENHSGSVRASALAVRGTARHQLARGMIASGGSGEEVRRLLETAQADLSRFLETHPKLDAAGAMAKRSQLISEDLRATG